MEEPKHVQERVEELEYLVRGCKNRVRVIKTNMEAAEFVQRTVEWHRERIKVHENQLIEILDHQRDGESLINDIRARITKMQQEIRALKNAQKIEQMRKLYEAVNRLRSELAPHVIEGAEKGINDENV
jgi:uncharacterized protein YigA (DUF484 family)